MDTTEPGQTVGNDGRPSANIYVDGFNLYRRCLQRHPTLKWLDLTALASSIMPEHRINKVHYFTAHLRLGLIADPGTPVRQQMYLRALATDPRVTIHLGKFRNDKRPMPVHPQKIDPETGKFVTVNVRKLEEKGSDVNLATRLLADAFQKDADIYVVLTNDSDQVGPLTTMKTELSVQAGIIFPMPSHRSSKDLVKTRPDFIGHVTQEALEASQFPHTLRDAVGKFHRPPKWS